MSGPYYAYVVIFDGVSVSEFTRVVDRSSKTIKNWMTVLPNTVFVVSRQPASALVDYLRKKMPGMKRVLVLDAKTDRNGWLPRSAW